MCSLSKHNVVTELSNRFWKIMKTLNWTDRCVCVCEREEERRQNGLEKVELAFAAIAPF